MGLLVLVVSIASGAPIIESSLNCTSIKIPESATFNGSMKVPMFTVRPQSEGACVVECDTTVNNTFILGCATFIDSAVSIFQKAKLYNSPCFKNEIEAPGEDPGTS